MTEPRSAVALFRSVGLLADGPLLWGRPLPVVGSGVVIFELPEPAGPSAPLDPARIGKWIERVGSLRLDGGTPTTRRLLARLARYWLPGQTVLFVGFATSQLGRRVTALPATPLGNRPPLADAHWLLALRRPEVLRIWWAATDAPEEYADAILDAFAEGVPTGDAAALPEPDLVLPWATLRRPTGEARRHGLDADLLEAPTEPSLASTPTPAPGSTTRARPRASGPAGSRARATGSAAGHRATPSTSPSRRAGSTEPTAALRHEPVHLSTEGLARLRAELDHLRRVERPAVVARVRAARELGDLRENAEYQAAREEQAFLEGRIQIIEDRLRRAVVVDRLEAEGRVALGSAVVVEIDGRTERYDIVGPAEADPGSGRLSVRSPIGAALLGAQPGDERLVATPSGERHLRVVAVE